MIDNFKLFENTQLARSILRKFGVGENSKTYNDIKELTKDHNGYLGFFVKMWLEQGVSFESLKELYDLIISAPYIRNLNKTITNYSKWEELQDDIISARNNWKIKQMISELPSTQKDLVNSNMYPLFLKLYDRKDKNVFIKKISRYKTQSELSNALNSFVNQKNLKYESILREVKNTNVDLIYKSKANDIIIIKVSDSFQLRRLAGDTSWCILDQSTFNSYNNGLNRQFVAFLTDLNDNYRKIGITYGYKLYTAHLVDDRSIYSDKLSAILLDRGFKLDSLKIKFDEINFNNTPVSDLIEFGISKDDILKNKSVFKQDDFKLFTTDEMENHGLQDKMEINYLGQIKGKGLEWIISRKKQFKLREKINMNYLFNLNPFPREIKMFDTKDEDLKKIFDYDSIDIIDRLQNSTIESFSNYGLNFNQQLYVLKYYGVGPHIFTWDQLVSYLRDNNVSKIDEILEFAKLNGYEVDTDGLIKLIQKSKFDLGYVFNSNPLNVWMKLSKKYPQIKSHVDKIVDLVINPSSSQEEAMNKFLDENKISSSVFLDIDEEYLSGYPKLKELCEREELLRLYKKVLPQYTTTNYALNTIKQWIVKIDRNKRDIDAQTIVDYFYPKLKNESFSFGRYDELGFTSTLYMITSLVKTDNIDLMNSLKISFSKDQMKFLIRILFNMESYNQTPYLREDFRLDDSEREKLCDWLVKNRTKVRKNYGNQIIPNMDIYQHESVSLIYYYFNWGFQNYFNLVKRTRNQADKWSKIDGQDFHQQGRNHVDYFSEIFNYLSHTKKKEELDELVDKIKSNIVLNQGEMKMIQGISSGNSRFYISI